MQIRDDWPAILAALYACHWIWCCCTWLVRRRRARWRANEENHAMDGGR
jgi:hypothetical protein